MKCNLIIKIMGHKIAARVLCIAFFIIMLSQVPLAALSAVEPLIYPAGEIGRARPFFIWQDIYRERDSGLNVSYRLTLQNERDNEIRVYNFDPLPRFRTFYLYALPSDLANGPYSYSIERMVDGVSSDARFYHANRYPLVQRFTVNTGSASPPDALGADNLIRYLYTERENTLSNGYNALFFSTSATVTMGVGLLFYKVFHFGIVSNIIAAVCGVSAVIGYGAAGYYTVGYISGRNRLQRIIDLDGSSSIRAGFNGDGVMTGAEFNF